MNSDLFSHQFFLQCTLYAVILCVLFQRRPRPGDPAGGQPPPRGRIHPQSAGKMGAGPAGRHHPPAGQPAAAGAGGGHPRPRPQADRRRPRPGGPAGGQLAAAERRFWAADGGGVERRGAGSGGQAGGQSAHGGRSQVTTWRGILEWTSESESKVFLRELKPALKWGYRWVWLILPLTPV